MPTTQTVTLPPRPTSWQDSATLSQIDPSTGVSSIGLSLTGAIGVSAAVESTETIATPFTANVAGSERLLQPDGTVALSVMPLAFLNIPLAASDGSAPVVRTGSATGIDTAGATFTPGGTASPTAALLVGTGAVRLPVAATARVSAMGPGNFSAQFITTETATVAETVTSGSSPASSVGILQGGFQSSNLFAPTIPVTQITGSVTQQLTIADAPTGWAQNLVFEGFDSSLGTLVGFSVTVSADSAGTAAAENLDASAGAVTIGQVATVTALRPDGSDYAQDTSTRGLSAMLGASDGAADFAGPSGASAATSLFPTFRPQSILVDTSAADLAPFTAGGPVAIPVASHGQTTVAGPGNLDVASTLQAGAVVTLTYDYGAAPVAAAPFTAANTTLAVAPNQSVAGVQGFGAGDTIDATGIAFDGAAQATIGANGVLTLTGSNGSTTIGFAAGSGVSAGQLHLAADASGTGTAITYDPSSLSLIGGADASTAYVGPVAGLQNQYVALSAQNIAVAATTDNWFLHGSTGADALVAHGGRNVLDGGGGSDLLVGGTGQDTFFVDASPGAVTWSTIAKAHAGDDATLFGIAPGQAITWQDGLGAAGFTGLTGTVTDAAGGRTSVTFSGFTTADLASGRLGVASGSAGSIPYVHIAVNA